MKKWISILMAITLMILLCSCGLYDVDDDSGVYWLQDESGFVDYEISGDVVRFRYSTCFVNETSEDAGIKLSAKFSRKELSGWLEYEDYFEGLDEHGEWSYQTIKSGEKAQLICTFEGNYLGGNVNEELSFPEEIIMALDMED